jgi:hypothetical protein
MGVLTTQLRNFRAHISIFEKGITDWLLGNATLPSQSHKSWSRVLVYEVRKQLPILIYYPSIRFYII